MNNPSTIALEQAAQSGDDMALLEWASNIFETNAYGSAESEKILALLKEASTRNLGPLVQWFLGGYYLQNMVETGTQKQALYWLKMAADNGITLAIDRLANLHLRGIGVPFSIGSALSLLQPLADSGFNRSAWDIGYLHSLTNEQQSAELAVCAFARSCAQGFPPAYYSLGLRFALGIGVAKDLAFGRALLLRAADGRFPDALAAANEYAPMALAEDHDQQYSSHQWYDKLKLNMAQSRPLREQLAQGGMTVSDRETQIVRQMESHFASLGHPAIIINSSGRLQTVSGGQGSFNTTPESWEWLSQQPRVAICKNFATREECAFSVFTASESLGRPDEYASETTSGLTEVKFFRGQASNFNVLSATNLVRILERRIGQMTDWAPESIEPSSVIRYCPGHDYQSHVDYFTAEHIAQNRVAIRDFSGQRVITFLLCVQPPEVGGDTLYDQTGLRVSHQLGCASIHYNVDPSGAVDPLSKHSGCEVERGEKWLLRTTLREFSRYPDSVGG